MSSHSQVFKLGIVLLFAAVAIGGSFYFYIDSLNQGYETYAVLPKGEKILIELVRTDEERARGLSGRQNLKEDEGMYFVFPREDRYGFWMKGMQFPIDIIWIHQGKVVGVSENVPHEPGKSDDELPVYHPSSPVNSVLEMRAGSAKRYTIEEGSKIQIKIIPKNK
jgi:uncharacterized membrane protein (UPF0127 family)